MEVHFTARGYPQRRARLAAVGLVASALVAWLLLLMVGKGSSGAASGAAPPALLGHGRARTGATETFPADGNDGGVLPLPRTTPPDARPLLHPRTHVVFDPDVDVEYPSYTVPAIAAHGEYTLAFAQARTAVTHSHSSASAARTTPDGCAGPDGGDSIGGGEDDDGGAWAPSDIVVKRSEDRGDTWGPMRLVAGNRVGLPGRRADSCHGTAYADPVPVSLGPNGGVLVIFTVNGTDVYVARSEDGLDWAAPEPLGEAARPPGWGLVRTGPGHGLVLRRGEHAGRVVAPLTHRLATAAVTQRMECRPAAGGDARDPPVCVTSYEIDNPSATSMGSHSPHGLKARDHVAGALAPHAAAPPHAHGPLASAGAALQAGAGETGFVGSARGAPPGGGRGGAAAAPALELAPAGLTAEEALARHAAVLLSDDGGRTWRVGGDVPFLASGEAQVAELPSGEVVASFADRSGARPAAPAADAASAAGVNHALSVAAGPRPRALASGDCRLFAVSKDGGETWEVRAQAPVADPEAAQAHKLFEPVVEAAAPSAGDAHGAPASSVPGRAPAVVAAVGAGAGGACAVRGARRPASLAAHGQYLLFTGTVGPAARLGVYASADGGVRWLRVANLTSPGRHSAGHSDLLVWRARGISPWGELGAVHERGPRCRGAIALTRYHLGTGASDPADV